MKLLIFISLLLCSTGASAQTISITIAELSNALLGAQDNPDAIRRMVLQRIEQEFRDAGIGLQQDSVLFTERYTNEVVEGGCNNTVIQYLDLNIALKDSSEFSFTLDSLHDPIEFGTRIDAQLDATGRAKQEFGFRLAGCNAVASDSFAIAADGTAELELTARLELKPDWVEITTLRLQPKLSIEGSLVSSNIRVDVDDSVFRKLIESFLQDELDENFGAGAFNQQLASLQLLIDDQLSDALDNGELLVELPPPNDQQVVELYRLLQPEARFVHSLAYLEQHWYELLSAIILGDETELASILENTVACEAGDLLDVDLPAASLYTGDQNNCAIADTLLEGSYFSDASCQNAVEYFPTELSTFCLAALDKNRVGNAASNPEELSRWTLSPGTRFDISALPLSGKQPFARRERFKSVTTAAGECELEMRIYDQTPGGSSNKPVLIAFHGGSWQNRGSGFLGVEAMATPFTNAGYIVFAPFYRLVGSRDGNAECNNASFESLLEDTNDALDWVQANAGEYGGAGLPVVFGQSAGGHLAASLAVHRKDEIAKAILFYAPLDFQDFAEQLLANPEANPTGKRILETVSGAELINIDLQSELIQSNRLPAIVAADPKAYPPMFMLHGEMDSLLPFRQSVLMCNALSTAPSGEQTVQISLLDQKQVRQCGTNGSELHLIAQGEHTLDLCIAPGLCFSGDQASADAVNESMQQMLRFASVSPLSDPAGTSSGGRASDVLLWMLLLMVLVRFYCGSRTLVKSVPTITLPVKPPSVTASL